VQKLCTLMPSLLLIFFVIFLIYCYFAGWGVHCSFCSHNMQKNHTWIHSLYHPTLFLLPPIPGIVSTGIIFPFTYMCTQYLHYIQHLTPLPHILPTATGTMPLYPRQDLLCPPVLRFCRRKRKNGSFVCLR
jgi:hypothetical protein